MRLYVLLVLILAALPATAAEPLVGRVRVLDGATIVVAGVSWRCANRPRWRRRVRGRGRGAADAVLDGGFERKDTARADARRETGAVLG